MLDGGQDPVVVERHVGVLDRSLPGNAAEPAGGSHQLGEALSSEAMKADDPEHLCRSALTRHIGFHRHVQVGLIVLGERLGDDRQRGRVRVEVLPEFPREERGFFGLLLRPHLVDETLERCAEFLGIDRHSHTSILETDRSRSRPVAMFASLSRAALGHALELGLVDDGDAELLRLLELAAGLLASQEVAGHLRHRAGDLAAALLDQGLGLGAAASGRVPVMTNVLPGEGGLPPRRLDRSTAAGASRRLPEVVEQLLVVRVLEVFVDAGGDDRADLGDAPGPPASSCGSSPASAPSRR